MLQWSQYEIRETQMADGYSKLKLTQVDQAVVNEAIPCSVPVDRHSSKEYCCWPNFVGYEHAVHSLRS